jgi:hypothetical protein
LSSGCEYDGVYERRDGKLIEGKNSFKNKDKGIFLYYSGKGQHGNGLWRLSSDKDTTLQSTDSCATHLQKSGSAVQDSMDPPLGTFYFGWQTPNQNIKAKVDYVLTCDALEDGTRIPCPAAVISGSQPEGLQWAVLLFALIAGCSTSDEMSCIY